MDDESCELAGPGNIHNTHMEVIGMSKLVSYRRQVSLASVAVLSVLELGSISCGVAAYPEVSFHRWLQKVLVRVFRYLVYKPEAAGRINLNGRVTHGVNEILEKKRDSHDSGVQG